MILQTDSALFKERNVQIVPKSPEPRNKNDNSYEEQDAQISVVDADNEPSHDRVSPQTESGHPSLLCNEICRNLANRSSALGPKTMQVFRSVYFNLKEKKSEAEKRVCEEKCGLVDLLTKIDSVETITAEFAKETFLNPILENLMGCDRFSNETIETARTLHDKFEQYGWGKPLFFPESFPAPSSASPTQSSRLQKKRRTDTSAPSANAQAVAGEEISNSAMVKTTDGKGKKKGVKPVHPNESHPIYGVRGVLNGIILKPSLDGRTASRMINPEAKVPPANTRGDKGLHVGQWWVFQLCLLLAGVHGCTQAGIYGNKSDGAFSIVITDGYDKMDKDDGNIIRYSAPLSPNKLRSSRVADKSEMLSVSLQNRQPVRVIRGACKSSPYAPKTGFRYDGLYTVTGKENCTDYEKRGAYVRYFLERIDGQPEIDRSRPTSDEIKLAGEARSNYPWKVEDTD